ncbi:unnamed protein product [Cuscuta epithymum]|uniref:Glycosyl transferase 64 domain-containing protein n=1 Tax=Cuscuta epithymum TaxID=186058 RepID=A0AAV0ECE6_9ASTE|nr:unnamed protein product [Cuscuta epithymum]
MKTSVFSRRMTRQGTISADKIKLFFCCCFLLALIALTCLLGSYTTWNIHSPSPFPHSSSPRRKGYTILINTWKRNDLLMQSISHYSSCPSLSSIHIVWSDPNNPPPSLIEFLNKVVHSRLTYGQQIELKFDFNHEDSLNNRFKQLNEFENDAVFSIDDDVIIPCSSVEFAFTVWKSAPNTMVGFVPRTHWVDNLKGEGQKYIYGGWWPVWWMGTYSMVLSKAAFFHKKYLTLYTNQMPASIRNYVTKNRNCEDIAMSFLVANETNAPPIWIQGKIFEIGSSGISSLGSHNEKRTQCVNRFVAEFGRMPLVTTSVKAIDSRHSWFW